MELIDFDQLCRICWKSDNLRTVFNEEIPSLCEMLMACSPIEVCEENGLPTKLCDDCGLELESAFSFRTKCITSELKFKKYLSDHGIETTVQYVHNPETDETIETIHTTVAYKPTESSITDYNNSTINDSLSGINKPNTNNAENDNSASEIKVETLSNLQKPIEIPYVVNNEEVSNDSRTDVIPDELPILQTISYHMKEHPCTQCKRSYSHPRNLKRHIKEHHSGIMRKSKTGSRDFRCSICRKIFSFRNALIRHLRVIHHNITQKCFKTIKGKKCCTAEINIFIENVKETKRHDKGIFGDIAASEDEFSVHDTDTKLENKIKSGEDNSEIKLEDETTIQNENMLDISNEIFLGSVDSILKENENVQMLQEDNQTVFIVDESLFNKIAIIAKNAAKSDKTNDSEFEHECQFCDSKFSSLPCLKKHITMTHMEMNDSGDDISEKDDISNSPSVENEESSCAKYINPLVSSENEIEIIDENGEKKIKYSCKLCDRSYNAKNNLHRHIKEKHLPKTSEPHRQFKCEMCGRRFARKGLLERHKDSHLERVAYQCEQCGDVFDKKVKLRSHVVKHETQKKFQCDICDKWFLRSTTLRVHKKQHASILPFPCPECDRAFSMRPALEAHVRTHSETRPYVCNICRRAFRHPGHLDTHLKLHTGERPYSCTMCEKRFTTSTHLKYHIKVHLDQRDFKCEICGRAFIHSSELKYHMISHSQIKERPCPVCGKLFARTNQVTKHLKQVHHFKKNYYAH